MAGDYDEDYLDYDYDYHDDDHAYFLDIASKFSLEDLNSVVIPKSNSLRIKVIMKNRGQEP